MGTSTSCPAADPAETTPSARPRRAVNQRATATAEVGLDAPPTPSMIRTPKIRYACQRVTIELTATVPTPRRAMLAAKITRGPVRSAQRPARAWATPYTTKPSEAVRLTAARSHPNSASHGLTRDRWSRTPKATACAKKITPPRPTRTTAPARAPPSPPRLLSGVATSLRWAARRMDSRRPVTTPDSARRRDAGRPLRYHHRQGAHMAETPSATPVPG
jgi:hypothetical protein